MMPTSAKKITIATQLLEPFCFAERKPTLAELQAAVGGYCEALPYGLSRDAQDVMLVNEDGLQLRLPHNQLASSIAGRPIVGDVVILPRRLLQ